MKPEDTHRFFKDYIKLFVYVILIMISVYIIMKVSMKTFGLHEVKIVTCALIPVIIGNYILDMFYQE